MKFDATPENATKKAKLTPKTKTKQAEKTKTDNEPRLNLFQADDFGDDNDNDVDSIPDDDDEIEEASRKIIKKQKKTLAEADEEVKTNIVAGSGDALMMGDGRRDDKAPDLQIVHQRIRDIR